jgi:hypothetical protein
MKRKVTNSIQISLRWLGLVVVLLLGMLDVRATSTFYYKATVTPSPAGAGKVYINDAPSTNPAYASGSQSKSDSQRTIGYGETTIYMYAQANDNYIFSKWTDGAGNTLGTSTSYNATIQYRSTDSGSPTTFNYRAVFLAQQGLIKVRSANESLGSVSNSNPNNEEGDVVTLTAYPDASNGVLFEGWTKDAASPYTSTTVVSTENPLVLTASSATKGTYTAHFSEAAQKVYVRLQNKKTGRFISFYGDNKGKGATNHMRTVEGSTRQDGFKFDGCWKLISASEAQGNPETVFLRAGHAGGAGMTYGANLTAHGIQYSGLIHETNTNNYMLTLEKSGDAYYIYTTFTGNNATLRSYFCDEGTDWLVMKSTADLDGFDQESAQWYVYALDANTTEGAFGANTKSKYIKEGKYYTTMYADFPYKCLDGVKAYYLKHEEATYDQELNVVYFTEVEGGKVPANMAVVLECDAVQNDFTTTKTVLNRLVPLTETVAPIINEGEHFLKGYVSVNGDTRANNKETMYVLSFGKTLGFYLYSKDNMNPNKAYLDTRVALDDYPNSSSVTFAFGRDTEGETNKITTHNVMVDDDYAPVYDLLGRQMVGDLPKGIYIRNGKKFVVK